MKFQTGCLLAAIAFTPAFSVALAGPPQKKPDSVTVTRMPTAPLSEEERRALIPASAETGPCRAELSMQRLEVSRSPDGAFYNVTVTIANIGTEAAVGSQTAAGGVLGVALEVKNLRRVQSYFAQAADIVIIHPLTSQRFSGSIPASEVNRQSTQITARINRGPDGPRCAYDARVNNDGIDISVSRMRDWLEAGNASYSIDAPWDR